MQSKCIAGSRRPRQGSGLRLFQGALRSDEFKLKSGINRVPLPRRMSGTPCAFLTGCEKCGLRAAPNLFRFKLELARSSRSKSKMGRKHAATS